MKKPKFNIGDKVKATAYGYIEGIKTSVELQWYICSITYCISGDNTVQEYYYEITEYPAQGYRKISRNENELTLVEKVKYEDE